MAEPQLEEKDKQYVLGCWKLEYMTEQGQTDKVVSLQYFYTSEKILC